MDTTTPAAPCFAHGDHLYVGRPPAPLLFPAEEEVPETLTGFEQRVALYESVKAEIASTNTIGSDQFLYWNPRSARKRCAPDLFVKLGVPHHVFDVWKVWVSGVPELAVEIVSKSDRPEDEWGEKLARYQASGVPELVRFDAEDQEQQVRVWDRVNGELVERAAGDPSRLACHALGLWWVVVDMPPLGPTLRLARDKAGTDLLPTPTELRVRAEQERRRAEQERAVEAEARARAEQERDALRKEVEALRAAAGARRAVPAAGGKRMRKSKGSGSAPRPRKA